MPKTQVKAKEAPQAELAPPSHSMSEDAGFKPSSRSRKPLETVVNEGKATMDPRRQATYDKFNEGLATGSKKPLDVLPEKSVVSADRETTDALSETSVDDPVADAALPLLPGESIPEDLSPTPAPGDKKDQKLVPLGALHEEREKHKSTKQQLQSLKTEADTLRNQLSEVLKDFKQSLDGKKSPNGDVKLPEPIDDIEAEVRKLRAENLELKVKFDSFDQDRKRESERSVENERRQHVEKTDRELEQEGFPGFARFVDRVAEKLVGIQKVDPELAQKLDTPAGWKRVYKEKVYPEYSSIFLKKQKEEELAGKTKLKERAGLSGSPGTPPSSAPKEEKPWTYNDYLTFRRKTSVH